jgi:hypothetical protein
MSTLTVSRAVKGANLLFAGTQSVGGQLSRMTGLGMPVDQRPDTFHAATPVGTFFAIWLPLFASQTFYAWRVARDGESPLHRDIAPLTALAFAGNTAWEVQAELRGFEWRSNAIILGTAAAACTAIIRAERGDYPEKRKVRLPVGVLAGWLIAASAANAEASRVQMLGRPSRRREESEASALILVAGAAAGAVSHAARGSAHVAFGAGWGLAGIAARAITERRPRMIPAAALGLGLTSLGLALGRRRGRR